MKLPYSYDFCVYLETMDDVAVFDKYASTVLANDTFHPLEFYSESRDRLPNYAFLVSIGGIYSWGDSNLPPTPKTLIPLDALFNYEKYPEYFI